MRRLYRDVRRWGIWNFLGEKWKKETGGCEISGWKEKKGTYGVDFLQSFFSSQCQPESEQFPAWDAFSSYVVEFCKDSKKIISAFLGFPWNVDKKGTPRKKSRKSTYLLVLGIRNKNPLLLTLGLSGMHSRHFRDFSTLFASHNSPSCCVTEFCLILTIRHPNDMTARLHKKSFITDL